MGRCQVSLEDGHCPNKAWAKRTRKNAGDGGCLPAAQPTHRRRSPRSVSTVFFLCPRRADPYLKAGNDREECQVCKQTITLKAPMTPDSYIKAGFGARAILRSIACF